MVMQVVQRENMTGVLLGSERGAACAVAKP